MLPCVGLQCGKILKHFTSHVQRVPRMIVWGLVLSLVGAALAEFKKNGGMIPLNKNLWWVVYVVHATQW